MIKGKEILEECFRVLKTLVKENEGISIPQPLLNYTSAKIISHYTSLSAFKGIIEGHSLWLSDVEYMNDPEEIKYGNKGILEALQDCTPNYIGSNYFDVLLKVRQSIEKKTNLWDMDGTPATTSEIDDFYRYFIASFSQNGDELTMWNTYKSAVSIQFESRILWNADIIKNYFLFDVSYDKEKFLSMVKQFIENVHDCFKGHLNTLEKEPQENRDEFLLDLRLSLAHTLAFLRWGFKNEHFSYEAETRFFHARKRNNLEGLDFHPKGDFLVPHILWQPKDTYCEADRKEILPIKSVTIAPRPKEVQRQMKDSITLFLAANGYSDVPVETSMIPFREF